MQAIPMPFTEQQVRGTWKSTGPVQPLAAIKYWHSTSILQSPASEDPLPFPTGHLIEYFRQLYAFLLVQWLQGRTWEATVTGRQFERSLQTCYVIGGGDSSIGRSEQGL